MSNNNTNNNANGGNNGFYEFELTEEIRNLGFIRVYIQDRTLVVIHSPDAKIYSKFIAGDLQTTFHHLEKAFLKYDQIHKDFFGKEKIEKFLALFGELKLSLDEQQRNINNAKIIRENRNKLQIIEEIRSLRESHPNITMEEWREGLLQRLNTLQQVVGDNIPELLPGLEFELSTLRILNIADCSLPFIGIILGRPAGGKTQVISLLKKWPYSFHSDVWSPKALQSHTSTASKEEDFLKIDMLPKFKDKIFCTPEFAPIFTTNDDQLRHTLGLITRIADGNGLSSDSGIHGHREYGNTMFVWVGAAVDVPHNVYKALATLGAKIYFFRLPYKERETDQLVQLMGTNFTTKLRSIETALFDYLKWFEICPKLIPDTSTEDEDPEAKKESDKYKFDVNKKFNQFKFSDAELEKKWIEDAAKEEKACKQGISSEDLKKKFSLNLKPPKIKLDPSKDDINAKKAIAELAQLLAYLRCEVKTWDTDKSEGLNYGYSASLREDSKRASDVLYNLACGHALTYGRDYLILEDVKIVVKTVLSTAEFDRIKTFLLLLMHYGKLGTTDIETYLHISSPTARRVMAEFRAIGMTKVDVSKNTDSHELEMELYDNFHWFLEKEFNDLRDGFEPADYRSYLDKGGALKERINYSAVFEHLRVFDKVFDELANREPEPLAMSDDKGTVGRFELVEKLKESDVFTEEQAKQIIDFMVKQRAIDIVMIDTYRRNDNYNDSFLRETGRKPRKP